MHIQVLVNGKRDITYVKFTKKCTHWGKYVKMSSNFTVGRKHKALQCVIEERHPENECGILKKRMKFEEIFTSLS